MGTPQGRALLVIAVASLGTALWAGTLRSTLGARAVAVLALSSLGPLLGAGHASTTSHHFVASIALLVHVLAAVLWMGGLAALIVHLRQDAEALRRAVPRFSTLALACFVAVGLSGALGAWTRLGTDPAAWRSAYGLLVMTKTLALVALGLVGWWHQR